MSTKNKEKCLIIVDMQAGFLSTRQEQEQSMITHIKQRINHYKSHNRPIMFLEYRSNAYNPDDNDYGRTIKELQDIVKHYYNVAFIGKANDDGSKWVERFLIANDYQENHFGTFELIGVNMDCCVAKTAKGIAKLHPDCKIKIRQSCCSSRSDNMYGSGGEDRVLRVTNEYIQPCSSIELIK